jgi:sialic acid synthase
MKETIITKKLPFVIAEIGHNHQGSLDLAKKMIKEANNCGASAVKLQKRSNKDLYTKEMFNSIYNSENSYAKTYGEHREYLEFDESQYIELKNYSEDLGIIFFSTPFDFESVEFLEKIDVPCYKIASADVTNLPLQEKISETGKPIILSTGASELDDVKRAHEIITKKNENLYILHCTASYPAQIEDMNLNCISTLKKNFPNNIIGLSDHENGIDAASIAYMLGARIFEKHFTLNRSWKGTDQSFSLEPEGLKKLIRNLNRIPSMLGSDVKKVLENEKAPIKKMAKSIVAACEIEKNTIIKLEHLAFKSPGGGLKPYFRDQVLGKKLKIKKNKDDLINFEDIE